MSGQEKKRQRIYELLNANTKPKFLCLLQTKKIFFFFLLKKSFLRKRGNGGLNQKRKEGFLTALATAIKKEPTKSIRKHANELKVHEKTVRIAIKQVLSLDLNPLRVRYMGRFGKEKKCNFLSKYWFT